MEPTTPPGAAADAERGFRASDCSRALVVTALAVLGPPLHALAVLLLLLVAGRQRLGAVRRRCSHLLLMHGQLAGLLYSLLYLLPLLQWTTAGRPLGEVSCRLGRCIADSLYATQTLFLLAAVLTSRCRPSGYLVTILTALLWLLGPGLNLGHVHWRVDAVVPPHRHVGTKDYGGNGSLNSSSCVIEEVIGPLRQSSLALAAMPGLVLPVAMPLLVYKRRLPAATTAVVSSATAAEELPLSAGQLLGSVRPLLAVLAAARALSCAGQLLGLQLSGAVPLLAGVVVVLRDAGVLLEVALLLTMYPGRRQLCRLLVRRRAVTAASATSAASGVYGSVTLRPGLVKHAPDKTDVASRTPAQTAERGTVTPSTSTHILTNTGH